MRLAVLREEQEMEQHHPLAANTVCSKTVPALAGLVLGRCSNAGAVTKQHPFSSTCKHRSLATVFLFLNCYKPPHQSASEKGGFKTSSSTGNLFKSTRDNNTDATLFHSNTQPSSPESACSETT